jgi:hypothetical protein
MSRPTKAHSCELSHHGGLEVALSTEPEMAAGTARSAWAATRRGEAALSCASPPPAGGPPQAGQAGPVACPGHDGWRLDADLAGDGGAGTEAIDGSHRPHPHPLPLSDRGGRPGPHHGGAAGSHLRTASAPGRRAATIQGVRRTFRACLAEAVRRGRLERNPALVARPGRADHSEVDPLSLGQARAIMREAAGRQNRVRWEVALIMGLRQGEALGLQWNAVHFDAGTLRVRRALQRAAWRHGCSDRDRCDREARDYPHRYGGGLVVVSPKSATSSRTMVLPCHVRLALQEHPRVQDAERAAAGDRWRSPPQRDPMNSGSG